MNWLIVEDALSDRKGHWLEYVSTFVLGLKELGDEVVVLCDRKAEGGILEQTGARPVLPESIWHRMGDGAGGLKRYLRVPGHAIATFFAMRKFFKKFNHNRARGQVRERATGGWPEGRVSRNERVKGHRGFSHGGTASTEMEAGQRWDKSSGAAYSNLLTREFGRGCENTSPARSASDPASSPATSYPLPETSSPPDWIFVPTVLVHHLLGWWLLLKMGAVPRASRVLLFFPNLPISLDSSGEPTWNSSPTTRLMAWLFAKMRDEVEGGKVVLGVETHAMRRALEGLIRMPVVYLPHPVEAALPPRTGCGGLKTNLEDCNIDPLNNSTSAISHQPSGAAKPIVFGCYGAARWEKGSDIFLEAIKLILRAAERPMTDSGLLIADGVSGAKALDAGRSTLDSIPTAAGRPLRFCIQWVEDFRDEEGNLVSIDPWLREHPQVEVIGRYFEGDDYERRLAQTDVMVLPYRKPYQLRVSRVVIEAMLNGLPVIATRGTTLFEQAEEYGVVVSCEEGDAQSLAEAMLEVAERFEILRSSAEEKVNAAAASFSVVFFRELLWRLCRRELKSEIG